jgi:hypothetical protein
MVELVHHLEAIALAQVAVEIDVAAEDVGELHGDAVGNVGRVGRREERAADQARLHHRARLEFGRFHAGAIALGRAADAHHLAPVEEAQIQRRAVGAHLRGDQHAGL